MVLDRDIKDHLIKVFGLVKTGVTEIRDNEVVRDGYTIDDLKAISLEKMIEYIGSTETFPRAWELTCMKVKHELNPPMAMSQETAAFVEAAQPKTIDAEEITKAIDVESDTYAKTKKGK